MAVGDRIKRVRNFRGMTMKELGMAVGFDEKSADVRIAQYENNSRKPKEELMRKIAAALDVSVAYLEDPTAERIRKMDLSTVAEFKRGANGAVEIKFVDRVKALGTLYEMLGGGDENEAAEFLQALEQAGEEKDDWRA